MIVRVRRDELYSPDPSPSSSPDPALAQAFLKSLGEKFVEKATSVSASAPVTEDKREQSEEVEFRLFATTSTNNRKAITKIRVQSPSLEDKPAGLVNPERSREFYFHDSLSPEAEGRLKLVAVCGEDVLARSRTKWPGCALPWRVTTILSTGKPVHNISSQTVKQTDVARRKRRKGKKTRIAVRKKAAEESERKGKENEGAAEKELAERAKRAKRNREKKLKKREREKAKRAAAGAAGEAVADSSDDAPV